MENYREKYDNLVCLIKNARERERKWVEIYKRDMRLTDDLNKKLDLFDCHIRHDGIRRALTEILRDIGETDEE